MYNGIEMNRYIDNTYWIAVAHLPKWSVERLNRFIVQIIHDNKMSWRDFFDLSPNRWKELFAFTAKEISDLELAKTEMPRLAFIAEQLQNEGYQIIPINSPDYPPVLKENLKIKSSPAVLYIKGRKGLLQEEAVAIVGSRNAGAQALSFTDHVARKCVSDSKVVVSGFARGVDKQALDSTLEANGKSIIVLPQGILTFQSGFKKYYEPIVNGSALVLSTFFPKAGWDVGLAMARNTYIYGLANEIYVAESDSKGGTWEGVIDGLKRQRKVFVRNPLPHEKNANLKLAELGAFLVDMNGTLLDQTNIHLEELLTSGHNHVLNEPANRYGEGERNVEKDVLEFLKRGAYTSTEILLGLKLEWDSRKLTNFLKKNPNVKTVAGRPQKFTLNNISSPTLFEK